MRDVCKTQTALLPVNHPILALVQRLIKISGLAPYSFWMGMSLRILSTTEAI